MASFRATTPCDAVVVCCSYDLRVCDYACGLVKARDVSPVIGLFGIMNEMVGDVERIQRYPALGYQSPHELPHNVLDAWASLVQKGFTYHLMPKA